MSDRQAGSQLMMNFVLLLILNVWWCIYSSQPHWIWCFEYGPVSYFFWSLTIFMIQFPRISLWDTDAGGQCFFKGLSTQVSVQVLPPPYFTDRGFYRHNCAKQASEIMSSSSFNILYIFNIPHVI